MSTAKIKQILQAAIASEFAHDIPLSEIKLERPAQEAHGDWSANIALAISKQVAKNPREIAQALTTRLLEDPELAEVVSTIEVAGPGFINFKFKDSYYLAELTNQADYQTDESQRIILEYGHPNTHKLPHIGHLFSYIAGDSISRILAAAGHEIFRVNYQGDIGPHVAKCIYGWIMRGKPEPETLLEKVQLLQTCYQEGSKYYEEEEHKARIQEINKAIYDPNSDIQADWKKTRQWSLDYYVGFEQVLGVEQKIHYLESNVWREGLETVKANIGEGKPFRESEGAVIFPGEEYGLHTRVFITKQGTPTYECKEVGLNQQKMRDWPYDLTIIPTASEQNGYFAVVAAAIGEAVPKLKGKIEHIGFGMVSLSTGKMSSRSGNILSAPDLVEQVKTRIAEVMSTREGIAVEEKEEIVVKVSLAAIKYAFLRGNILQNMAFDLEESISFEGNSGPYLQYTYARIASILRQEVSGVEKTEAELVNLLTEPEELVVAKQLERWNEVLANAAANRAPHLIATYTFELAQKFNQYYKKHSINSAESGESIAARRFLAGKVANRIKLGLNLLGIETVEKM